MGLHSFSLIFQGPDPTEEPTISALWEAGCDDALWGVRGGVPFADFDRESDELGSAVLSAIEDVEKAVPALTTVRVEPEDLVTASGIAARTSRSRESIRLLIEGKRGPGGFPAPVMWLERHTRLWKWAEVSTWLSSAIGYEASSDGATVAAINGWLELRRYAPALHDVSHKNVLRSGDIAELQIR